MATNSGRGDPIPAPPGPSVKDTSVAPALSAESKSAILNQEQHNPNNKQHGGLNSTATHDGGQDENATAPKVLPKVESATEALAREEGLK